MKLQRGFTIIELMIVVLIIAVLIVIAAPSMKTMILSNTIRSVSSDFKSDFARAKSEAVTKSSSVVMCVSADQSTCTSGTWADGWIVFIDSDKNGQRNGPDTIIKVHEAIPKSLTFVTDASTSAGSPNAIIVRSIGMIDARKDVLICPAELGTVEGRRISSIITGRFETTTQVCS